MTCRGHIHNGVVVFDESAPLVDGTRVRIEPETAVAVGTPGEQLLRFQGLIDPESLREMADAIDRDCGQVDTDDMTLVTRDAHFRDVEGLRLDVW